MPLLSVEQVAACFQVSVSTIHRYTKAGLLTPIKVGKFARYREDFVLAVKEVLNKEKQIDHKPSPKKL